MFTDFATPQWLLAGAATVAALALAMVYAERRRRRALRLFAAATPISTTSRARRWTRNAVALVGVAFASREHQAEATRKVAAGVGLALLAAVGFGFYFPPMHAAGKVDFWWAAFVFRLTTLALVASAVAIERPALRVSRRDLLICAGVGIGDTLGNALYAAASRSGLESLTSVLASLYPIVTVALAATGLTLASLVYLDQFKAESVAMMLLLVLLFGLLAYLHKSRE